MPGTRRRPPVPNRRKVGTKSSHHAPYVQGCTRATMAGTKGCELARVSQSQKTGLSSDRSLQLDCMKSESLVIADQHAAVNTFPGLVHTARHTTKVGNTRSQWPNPQGGELSKEQHCLGPRRMFSGAKRVPNVDTGYSARWCLSTSAYQPVALRTQFEGM